MTHTKHSHFKLGALFATLSLTGLALPALAYDSASTFILVTIVMTVVIDYASAFLRRKII